MAFIFKRVHMENFFHQINNLHQIIKITMEEGSVSWHFTETEELNDLCSDI